MGIEGKLQSQGTNSGAFTGGGSFENILLQQGIEVTRPSLGPLGLSLVVVVLKHFAPVALKANSTHRAQVLGLSLVVGVFKTF